MKKLLTLMTLLIVAVTGAWATNVDIFTATATTAWSVPAGTSDADVSAKATIVGGKMTVYNGQESAVDLIKSNGSKMSFSQTNGNTMFKVTLPTALAVGDIITVDVYSNKAERGVWLTTSEAYPSEGGKKINTTNNNAKAWNNGLTYTLTADDEDLVGQTSFYIHRATSNTTYFANFKITRNISAPYIWTQPQSANYSVDDAATALTVAAIASTGDLTYQWYKNTDGDTSAKVEDQIAEATSATLASGKISTSVTGTFYYYCVVGDGGVNSSTSSKATITVSAAEAPTKPEITADPGLTVAKSTEVTLTAASASGSPAPTYTWYQCDNAEKVNPVEKASTASYSPSTAVAGTFYFYAVAENTKGSATSDVVTLTVNASNLCKLTKAYYDNGFFGEITQPTTEPAANGTIKVYYLSTESKPSISAVTISEDATYDVSGSVLTVTAEDGTTTADYDITMTAVTPYSGTGEITFDGTETWVRDNYGFGTESGKEGWKMVQPSTEERRYNGNTRVTFFLAPSSSVTFTTGSSNDRYLNVYRNLTKVEDNYKLAKNSGTLTVTGDENNPYIIVLEQNQTGGDAAIKAINVTKTGFESGIITASGWNTFSSSSNLDLSQVTGGTAFVATTTSGSNVTLAPVEDKIVTAGTGLMIKGNANEAFKIATTTNEATYSGDNLLVGLPTGGTVEVAGSGYNYVFGWIDPVDPGFYLIDSDQPTLGANKAYLHTTEALSKLSIIIDETPSQEETDGISSVEGSKAELTNAYNVAGQKVGSDYKGIVIINGKKYVRK